MRTAAEILRLILETAQNDNRIRAVLLSGSRADVTIPPDPFQDFDITYFVTDVSAFTRDHTWIDRFGDRLILQMPETMLDPPAANNAQFAYLMQFTDGSRIDLTLAPLDHAQTYDDGPAIVLLDKDRVLENRQTTPRQTPEPTPQLFSDCCNEFWWMCLNIAKGLWRKEIVFAKHMFQQVHRHQLLKMLVWSMPGARSGKFGRHLEQYLEPELWRLLLATYSDAGIGHTWDALEAMCALFQIAARRVSERYRFPHAMDEEAAVVQRLRLIRSRVGTLA